jgi:hypothetical protein
MKRLLLLLYCSIIIFGVARSQSGTKVTSSIVPNSFLDNYATHQAAYGKGGYRSVKSPTERDAILTSRRDTGMLVYVISEDKIYTLKNGILNANWEELKLGGSTDSVAYTRNNINITTSGYTYTFRTGGTNTNYTALLNTYDTNGNPVDAHFTKANNSITVYPSANCKLDALIVLKSFAQGGGSGGGGSSTWSTDSVNYASKSFAVKAVNDSSQALRAAIATGGTWPNDSARYAPKSYVKKAIHDSLLNVVKTETDPVWNSQKTNYQLKGDTANNSQNGVNTSFNFKVLQFLNPVKVAYDTIVKFNNACTDYATHTATHNDSLVIQTSDAIDNSSARYLIINTPPFNMKVGAFGNHINGFQDNSYTYTLFDCRRIRGLYIVYISNFD